MDFQTLLDTMIKSKQFRQYFLLTVHEKAWHIETQTFRSEHSQFNEQIQLSVSSHSRNWRII